MAEGEYPLSAASGTVSLTNRGGSRQREVGDHRWRVRYFPNGEQDALHIEESLCCIQGARTTGQ